MRRQSECLYRQMPEPEPIRLRLREAAWVYPAYTARPGRECIRQEVLKLRIGNAPVISGLFLAAGVPDAQLTVRIIGKAGAINEVLIPLPAARRKNGVGISRP